MRKTFLLKTMLLLCALVAGSSSVWATDFTLTSASSVTQDGITISFAQGSGSTAPTWYAAGLRLYANNTITISSSSKIAAITFNWEKQGEKAFNSATASTGSYTHPSAAGEGTWSGSASSVTFTLGSSGQLQLNTLSVILETPAPSHDITAVSNNDAWGTVSLTGSTITASPTSGYQVSTSNPYTVTSGTATVAQSGNAFVVTPSTDCTVRINFEAIPTYIVTIVDPDNGSLTVKVGDDDVTSGDALPAGTVLSITATPDAEYNFRNIQVVDASTHTYTASNTKDYNLTANNTTIRANFDAKIYHNVNWYVNGTISSTVAVEEGQAITKPAVDPADMGGKKFMGWSDSSIDGTTDTKPTYFTSATMSTSDVNYYAVFATASGSGVDTYAKITSSTLDTDETYVIGAEQSSSDHTMWYLISYAEVDKNSSWGVATNTPASVAPLKFNLSVTESSLIAQDENGNYLVPWKGNFRMESKSSSKASFSLNETGVLSGKSGGDGTTDVNLRYNHSSGSGGFRWYDGSTGTQAYLYKVIPGYTYSAYCTTIPPVSITPAYAKITYVTPCAMDFTGVDGLKAYVATDADASSVTMTKVEAVPESTPLLLIGTAGTTYNVPVVASATAPETNLLSAGDGTTEFDGTTYDYLLYSDGKFYQIGSGTIAVGKAYLHLDDAPFAARSLNIVFGDETDGITTNNREAITNNRYYNLQGVEVAQPTRGLYIVNGKKVFVK